MEYSIGTKYAPCTVEVVVKAKRPFTLRVQTYDGTKDHTYLTNRTMPINMGATETLYVQMPLTPSWCKLSLTDDSGSADQSSFDVVKIRKLGLPRQMDVSGLNNARTRSFVRFVQRFCYNAGWLAGNIDNQVYSSDDGEFKIKYLPIITDAGVEVTTPARINKFTRIIEVSKRKFIDLTVPERLCILLHEYSHMYLNEQEADELEADLNGLTIYLALGYPRIEALEVFVKTFYTVPTPQNLARFQHIENFINRFDSYFFDRRA